MLVFHFWAVARSSLLPLTTRRRLGNVSTQSLIFHDERRRRDERRRGRGLGQGEKKASWRLWRQLVLLTGSFLLLAANAFLTTSTPVSDRLLSSLRLASFAPAPNFTWLVAATHGLHSSSAIRLRRASSDGKSVQSILNSFLEAGLFLHFLFGFLL